MAEPEQAELRSFIYDFTGKPPPGRLFIDTNVVIALQLHEMAMGPPPLSTGKPYGRKSPGLVDFLRRARIAGAELLITPAVVEEVFHVACRKLLTPKQEHHGCSDSKELRRKHPDEFTAAVKNALKSTQAALKSIGKHSIMIEMPICDDARRVGRKIIDAFTGLVENVPQIGGKDALHIVTASLLNCTGYISNDGDFRFVAGRIVYCETQNQLFARCNIAIDAKRLSLAEMANIKVA